MTEHQPGTVLPLSECKPGWLVKVDGVPGVFRIDRNRALEEVRGNTYRGEMSVTLISALPGWTPVGEGDPTWPADICWSNGDISNVAKPEDGWWNWCLKYGVTLDVPVGTPGIKPLFWRDASVSAAPTPEPPLADLAARLAELRDTDMRTVLDAIAALEADMSLVRQILHIPNAETKAALAEAETISVQRSFTEALRKTLDFTTSRKPADPAPTDDLCPVCDGRGVVPKGAADPAPGVMTDDEIVASGEDAFAYALAHLADGPASARKYAFEGVVELTRASDRAAREARTESLLQAMKAIALACPEAREMANAALKAHKEGV